MNLFVARHTERHQVICIMRAALGQRLDVMYECRRHEAPMRSAHLAQRFSCQVSIANLSPHAAVSLMMPVASSKALVVLLHRLLMLLAISALPICKIRTIRHAARTFRFPRHLLQLLPRADVKRALPMQHPQFLSLHYITFFMGLSRVNFWNLSSALLCSRLVQR